MIHAITPDDTFNIPLCDRCREQEIITEGNVHLCADCEWIVHNEPSNMEEDTQ